MMILVPHVSCLCDSTKEFEEAIAIYPEVYVRTSAGYLKHIRLRNGRFVRVKVSKLPGKGVLDPIEIKEELNFLPDGKIPFSYFEQIVQFFRAVLEVRKISLEAHAWILWSKETGYYISVPPQTVGGASVSFTYTQEALPDGHIIVVDMHSHNSMNAFFSGTDNNNDKSGIYYSGVIGKLTPTDYVYVMRFNAYEDKADCDLEDIFEMPTIQVPSVPVEWLDKVSVVKPVFGTRATMGHSTIPEPRATHRTPESTWENWLNETAATFNPRTGTMEDFCQESGAYEGGMYEGLADHFVAGPLDEEPDPVGDGTDGDPVSDSYEELAREFGVDIADAVDAIDMELMELQGEDELLVDIMRNIFSMLSDKGRTLIQNKGL